MFVQAIHSCAIKFPEVASTVVHLLMNFLGNSNVASAIDVIRAARVCLCALWIIGEYCLSLSEVESGLATIKQCLGDLPFFTVNEEGDGTDNSYWCLFPWSSCGLYPDVAYIEIGRGLTI
ncbi:hypothetical protein MKW92_000486 [Papaver armeniacum]|nr:hypothetical protein MKW92_000486 [Papaver armeniacum]